MKSSKYLLAAGALLALVASPALAYEAGTWVLRAGVGVVAPDSDNFVDDDGTATTTVTVDDGTSLTLMGTYMFSRHWAFDILAAWPFNHDIKLGGTKIAETDHLPPTFSMQYHFLPDSTIQPYVGAGVNYTTFFSTKVTQELTDLTGVTDVDLDDSFGLALQLGELKLSLLHPFVELRGVSVGLPGEAPIFQIEQLEAQLREALDD